MRDPLVSPMVRVCFTMPDGTLLEREWSMFDFQDGANPVAIIGTGPPDWLANPSKKWPHPQDPITFTGMVRDGFEDEARAYVEAL